MCGWSARGGGSGCRRRWILCLWCRLRGLLVRLGGLYPGISESVRLVFWERRHGRQTVCPKISSHSFIPTRLGVPFKSDFGVEVWTAWGSAGLGRVFESFKEALVGRATRRRELRIWIASWALSDSKFCLQEWESAPHMFLTSCQLCSLISFG